MSGVLAVVSTAFVTVKALASPTYVSGSVPGFTGQVTCFPSGGIAPYSYEWIDVNGISVLSPTNPNNNTTRFAGSPGSSDFYCRVTDNAGQTADSNTITAELF